MTCNQCGFSGFQELTISCPHCGMDLQRPEIDPDFDNDGAGGIVCRDVVVTPHLVTHDQPLPWRLGQLVWAVIAYIFTVIGGYIVILFVTDDLLSTWGAHHTYLVRANAVRYLPAAGCLIAGAFAGANSTTWLRQGIAASLILLAFHLPAMTLFEDRFVTAYWATLRITLPAAPLGALLGRLAMCPTKVLQLHVRQRSEEEEM